MLECTNRQQINENRLMPDNNVRYKISNCEDYQRTHARLISCMGISNRMRIITVITLAQMKKKTKCMPLAFMPIANNFI